MPMDKMKYCKGLAGIGQHLLVGDNVHYKPNGTRECKVCHNERARVRGNPWRKRMYAQGIKFVNGRLVYPEDQVRPDKSDHQLDMEAAEWLSVRG